MDTPQELIDTAIEFFDFERVHKMMVATNHTWWHGHSEAVPSVGEIRSRARLLLNEMVDNDFDEFSSGPFFMFAKRENGRIVSLRLIWGVSVIIDAEIDE